jgi:hypothetical protein
MKGATMFILAVNQDLIIAGIILLVAIIIIFVTLHYYNKNINVRKYKKAYKKILKLRDKKYNANVLIDVIYNQYSTDDTNTEASLKRKGRKIVKKYIKYYQQSLNQLTELKANISPNKKLNKLIIIIKDPSNKEIGSFYIKDKYRKIRKIINKHQLLFDMLAYLYELPTYIDTKKSYLLENHDNKNSISYELSKTSKK